MEGYVDMGYQESVYSFPIEDYIWICAMLTFISRSNVAKFVDIEICVSISYTFHELEVILNN